MASTKTSNYAASNVEQQKDAGRINVMFLCDEWKSSKGGLSTFNREFAVNLAKTSSDSIKVHCYVSQSDEQSREDAKQHGVNLITARSIPGSSDPLDWLKIPPPELPNPDIVIGHGRKFGTPAYFIVQTANCKWVQFVHVFCEDLGKFKETQSASQDTIEENEKKHKSEIELCKAADWVVAVGSRLQQKYSRSLPNVKVEIITPGIIEKFSRESSQLVRDESMVKKFNVFMFGRATFEDRALKGYDIVANAIGSLDKTVFELTFVGASSGEHRKIEQWFLDNTCISRKQLTIRSYCNEQDELKMMFHESDVVVLPSRTEGFGLVALEAISAGIPVLVAGESGIAEALQEVEEGNSVIVKSDDAKEWARRIQQLYNKSPEERQDGAKLLRGNYDKSYPWSSECEKFEKMICVQIGLQMDCEAISGPGPSRGPSELATTTREPQPSVHSATVVPVTTSSQQASPLPGFRGDNVAYSGLPPTQVILNSIVHRWFQVVNPSTPEELNGFLRYLKDVRNVLIVGTQQGSLIITLQCRSLQILDDLWKDYSSGHLNNMAQRFLVTKELLEEFGLTAVKLTTTIMEKEYIACRQYFIQSKVRLRLQFDCEVIRRGPGPLGGSSESVAASQEPQLQAEAEATGSSVSGMWCHHRNPPKDLRDKLGGHGRKRRSEDVAKIDGPKRRRVEVGEGTGKTPRPIGFRELENICKEDLTENVILGLNNKAKNFEALLSLEEIRPDLLKLVISAFHLLCSASNLMRENSEKMLRSPATKTFMTGPVLSSFINQMPHSECWKDEHDRVTVISDLTEIFLALIQRFGESIVHSLPLPQLSTSVNKLKETNLIEDASDLDKKIQQVKDLKIEVIQRAKTLQDQQSGPEPPQNFRELSVIPQAADLCFKPFLRENITDRRFKDLEHYLDVQFRLLREDFVMPLRNGIKQLTKESYALETKPAGEVKRANDVSVYHDVTVLYPVCSRKGRAYRIRFDRTHPKVKRVNWERSKRLTFGSLVCLSSDEFRTLVFASVENRDAEGLKVGELDVRFENVSMEEINQFVQRQENFVMIETPAYFEAYRHILEALKEIKPDELPFQKHVVECCKDVGPPEYQVRKADNCGFMFNFTGVLAVETSENPAIPLSGKRHEFHYHPAEVILDPSSQESPPESGISQDPSTSMDVPMDEEPPSAGVKLKCTADLHKWPDSESLGFNDSQMRAFKLALTKNFAVIQGPPGTGKTYVGLKIARVLLQTASLWEDEEERSPILMVSYTNHALDQFLEGLLSTTQDIVRVGGRSRSEKLKFVSLKNLQESMRQNRLVPDQIHRARMQIVEESDRKKRFFERSFELLKILKRSIVSMKVFGHPDYMLTAHYTQLLENAWQGSIDEALLDWLEIEKSAGQEDEDYFDDIDDELDDFSAPGFTYDNSPFDDKDLNSRSLQVEALSIEDVADPRYVRRNLTNEEVMTEDEEVLVDDIYLLETEDRWKLYRLWRQRVKAYHQGLFEARQGEYEQALERKQEVTRVEEYEILRKARVIGMTTTCAARYRHILQQIRPRIVLVEEAAEVFEAHIITSLTSGCEHLILIGDHQQLRPTPAVYELAKKYKLDVSLFERMVNVGIHCERLSVQHRMRPEIAALMRHIYDDLENHKSVENYEDIKGMKKNMYFIDHKYLEKSCDQSHSHVNEHEAKFVVALCRYLLQQGYKASQITILTTYMGQMFAIRDCLLEGNKETVKSVRLSTVDNFQGEENDIILLSLVRSNKTQKVGFIKIVNRACVALSRAKKGFYCIGNFCLLSKHSDIWKKIVADLKASGSIGNALPLVCRIHHDEIAVKTPEDFSAKAPNGGCQRPCEVRLECGHACKQFCHPYDIKHREYYCLQPCSKKIVGCDHDCPNLCWEACERNCGVLVTKKVPGCGHPSEVRCDTSPRRMTCKQRCEKVLSCGHQCQGYCGAPCTKKCQELVKKPDWPCGHGATIACSATPADCQVPCQDKLECGHKCSGKCGDCRMGRVHKRCKMRCGRPLICSHLCKVSCRTPCPPCTSKCENRCVHSVCPKTCGEPCNPCREKCDWECRHYKCSKKCGELCDRPTCDEPCNKTLPCQHQCRGLMCEEECICTECMENDGHEPITTIFFGTEQDKGARFIKLPDCQHIFEMKGLDSYMGISNNDSDVTDADDSHADIAANESEEIQLKPCPRCKTPIRRSLRYGNVIKQQLHDIEKVKVKLLGDSKELGEKKDRLYRRFNKLPFAAMLDDVSGRERMDRRILRLKSTWMAAIYENKLTLLERYCDVGKKLRSILDKLSPEICTENKLKRQQFEDELEYLKGRFLSGEVTQTELKDINTEFSRLELLLELCLLSHDIKSLEVELDEPSSQMMTAVKEKLSSGKRIEDEKLNEMMTKLKDIRQAHSKLPVLTEEEKKMIVSAMGLSKGHWFKCPKGHIYAIDRCGGATERGTCPECGAVIGGENHRLVDDNELAPEMDGATHAAWSEQANLQNYENLNNIV